MNENNNSNVKVEIQPCNEGCDWVCIPREEYVDLVTARNGIDLIGSSLGKFGGDDHVVKAVCRLFGYEYTEEKPDAE